MCEPHVLFYFYFTFIAVVQAALLVAQGMRSEILAGRGVGGATRAMVNGKFC